VRRFSRAAHHRRRHQRRTRCVEPGRFPAPVKRRAKLDLRVLSGDEEAYYGYLGAINTLNERNGVLFDLGGGSIEITRIANRKLAHSTSLPLGVVRVAERFMRAAPPSHKQMNALSEHIASQLSGEDWIQEAGNAAGLVGMGGTARALAKLDQEASHYPLERLHGHILTRKAIDRLIEQMSPMDTGKLMQMPGMNIDRVDVILPGAIVVRELMRAGGFDQFTVSGAGVREGLFFTEFLSGKKSPILPDVRAFSIENTARQYGAWNLHAQHVRTLTLQLFDQLQPLHGYGAWEREMLGAAALLHDVGYAISFYDHDQHSQYLIMNSDLSAYTHRELAFLGLLARYHRKGAVDCQQLCTLLENDDLTRITVMAAMLRLSEFLERGRRQTVRQLTCNLARVRLSSPRAHAATPRSSYGKRT